jgi:hypothetical protein
VQKGIVLLLGWLPGAQTGGQKKRPPKHQEKQQMANGVGSHAHLPSEDSISYLFV